MSTNKVILHGRMTADPELRYTKSGTAITEFNLAVEEDYSKDGEDPDTNFPRCIAWRGLAELLAEKVGKGCRINVNGMIQTDRWEDNSGEMQYRTVVKVIDVDIIDWKDDKQDNKQDDSNEPKEDTEEKLDVPF